MADEEPPGNARRFVRPVLRPATLILPRTGERVKRNFSLRQEGLLGGAFDDNNDANAGNARETSPLLGCLPSPSSTDPNNPFDKVRNLVQRKLHEGYTFASSDTGLAILKCSIAYLLASMATFVPGMAAWYGKSDGKHMVATITVYFHPARTAGSMHQATLLALAAFLYAALISLTSMAVSVFFGHLDLLEVGHAVVLIFFCGGGLGFVGWLKQKLGHALVNVACSLASLAIITVLTKEGSVQAAQFSERKVVQVLKMVLTGIAIATGVNLLFLPKSAQRNIDRSFVQATNELAAILIIITRGFLSGSDEEIKHPAYTEAAEKFKKEIAKLPDHLHEAKFELYVQGREKQYRIEARLVQVLQKLSQNISALRSAAATQFSLLKEEAPINFGASPPLKPIDASIDSIIGRSDSNIAPSDDSRPDATNSAHRSSSMLASIDELPEDEDSILSESLQCASPTRMTESIRTASTPAEMFIVFMSQLGPPMKSLVYTLKEILNELPYGGSPDEEQQHLVINENFRPSLSAAIDLYTNARKSALELVYKHKAVNKQHDMHIAADLEEVAASCGYFSSSLQDFAEDVLLYLDTLQDLKAEFERQPRPRSWSWLFKWWFRFRSRKSSHSRSYSSDTESLPQASQQTIDNANVAVKTPKADSMAMQSKQAPSSKSRPFSNLLFSIDRFLARDDVRFAVKVGFGAAIYAFPSFHPSLRPIYSRWRGEWGLLSYMLVCSMTIGASNTTGWHRFAGTCLGAVCAIAAWALATIVPAPGDAILLAFEGWLVSLGCFYVIIALGKGPLGRFILLTYNLSALYAYSLSIQDVGHKDDDEGGVHPAIWEIVLHRVVAVMVGCIWGVVITRLIWPISARRKLKDGISMLWLRMGLLWKRDPLRLLLEETTGGQGHNDLSLHRYHTRLHAAPASYMDIREEFALHTFLAHLEGLQKAAKSEFDLRASFPEHAFKGMLEATSRMLDAFHAMNVVIAKDLKASPGEARVLRYTTSAREELSRRISHLFSVLASSLRLEYPLNDALPDIEHTRDRLLAKVWEFKKSLSVEATELGTEVVESGGAEVTEEDFELLYAYALVTGQLARDIKSVQSEIESLYGVLDEDSLKLE